MEETGYYPLGAEHDSNAPYNQHGQDSRQFDVTISQTLSKNTKVNTNDYTLEETWDDDFGKGLSVNTEDTDWKQAYQNNHETVESLLSIFSGMLKDRLKSLVSIGAELQFISHSDRREIKRLQYLIKECDGWCVDDFEVIEG